MSGASRGRHFRVSSEGAYETSARGLEVLETPFLNKGSAFTLEERRALAVFWDVEFRLMARVLST